jgi:uncharacterized iron-regulated protein
MGSSGRSAQIVKPGALRLAAGLALASMAWIAGCAAPSNGEPQGERILEVRTGRWIAPAELELALERADYVLLGETHDNPHHHRLQAELLDSLSRAPSRPALVMEMFDTDDQQALDARRAAGGDADALARAGGMEAKQWRWDLYRPLVDLALKRELPLAAANLSRQRARDVVGKGLDVLPEASRLELEDTWNAQREAALGGEIRIAHCGELPEAMLPGMVRAQRARDAVMADVMLRFARAVLIAGRGHARNDYGVPVYLHRRSPRSTVVSVGFTERQPGAALESKDMAAFDYVWPTVPAQRPDPCAGLRMGK